MQVGPDPVSDIIFIRSSEGEAPRSWDPMEAELTQPVRSFYQHLLSPPHHLRLSLGMRLGSMGRSTALIPAQCVGAVMEAAALPTSSGELEPLGSGPVEDGRDQVDDFINSLKLPLGEALIKSPPTLIRVSRAQDSDFIPRRSSRLADKPRAARPEVQAKNVLLGSPKRSECLCRAPSGRRCASCYRTARGALDRRLCSRPRQADELALRAPWPRF